MEARKKGWKKEMTNAYENQDIEFKQEYVSDINKEVIAFVNADGGTILIGVRNNGEVCGVDNPDFTMQQVTARIYYMMNIEEFVCFHTNIRHNAKRQVTNGYNQTFCLVI